MKALHKLFLLVTLTFMGTMFWGCGGGNSNEKEPPKTTAADLFKDEPPKYDPKAINPDAPVSELNITAHGVSMTDMSYDPKLLTVKAGTTVKLHFKNASTDAALPHNWVLVYYGTIEAVANAGLNVGKEGSFVPNTPDVLVAARLLGPQEETDITFPAPPPGKYQFVCTYPGHWTMMNGEFIVE